jgi:hypothetical protein
MWARKKNRAFDRRRFDRLVSTLDQLGPMTRHNDHKNGYANCPACVTGHRFAPHFTTCDCGHCPDVDTAQAAVTQDLRAKDGMRIFGPEHSRDVKDGACLTCLADGAVAFPLDPASHVWRCGHVPELADLPKICAALGLTVERWETLASQATTEKELTP